MFNTEKKKYKHHKIPECNCLEEMLQLAQIAVHKNTKGE